MAASAVSAFTTHYLGFTMALNYSIVLVSIQDLWLILGGNITLYGFAFGSFALGQTVISPLLGYMSDVRGLKFALIFSLGLNVIGNALYSLSYVSKSLYLLLFGRFIAGLGSGAVALALVFLTNTTPPEKRGKSVASFKLSQAIGFLGGPLVGMFVIPLMGSVSNDSSIASRMWNVLTVPAWIALGNSVVIMLPLIKYGFKNPLAPHMALKFNLKEARPLVFHTVTLMSVLFFATACFWGIASDLFAFAFGQYHLIDDQNDLWKIYISGGAALALTGLLIRLTIHWKISPAMCTICGLTGNVLGFALLLDYNTKIPYLKNGFFFSGVALATSGAAGVFTGLGTYYSQKITEFSYQARNRRGVFLGLFNFAEAIGRFIGPTFIPLVLRLEVGRNCVPKEFTSHGCRIAHVNLAVPVLCGIFFIDLLLFIYYHLYHGKEQASSSLLANQELQPGLGQMSLREEEEEEENSDRHVEATEPRLVQPI